MKMHSCCRYEPGFVLPAVLLGAITLAIIWGMSSFRSHQSAAEIRFSLAQGRNDTRALNTLIADLGSFCTGSEILDCRTKESGAAIHASKKTLCALCKTSLKQRTLVNYNSLFADSINCCESSLLLPATSGPAFVQDGLASSCTCKFALLPPDALIIRGNLIISGEQPLPIPPSRNPYYLIAATGWVHIMPQLISGGDLAIVAGGSMELIALQIAAGQSAAIELLSAAGSVKVSRFIGDLALHCQVAELELLPPGIRRTPHTLLPRIPAHFLGFSDS